MNLPEPRCPLFGKVLLKRVGLAWGLACVLLLLTSLPAILAARFPDPDDTLRLVQVRDLIAGQSWFDMTQHRIDAAHGGVPMHWSRLVDLPLAAMILLFRPLLGMAGAEQLTIVLMPLLTLGLAMLLAGRIAWRFLDGDAVTYACLTLVMAVPVVYQLRPLRIDHHGWQIVAALAAVNGLMANNRWLGGWLAGLALACGLSISIEGLPFAVVIAGIAALRWFRGANERNLFAGLMQGLALGSAGFFLATRWLGDGAVHCDAISPIHLAVFGWGAAVITLLRLAKPVALLPTLAVFGVAALGAVALMLGFAPQCATGNFDMLDPVVKHFWYDRIVEGLPIWRQDPETVLQLLVPMALAIHAALRLADQANAAVRRWWLDYALLLTGTLLIAMLVARAAGVAEALAAVPLGWRLKHWISAARNTVQRGAAARAFAGIILAIQPALPLTLGTLVMGLVTSAPATARVSDCRISDVASNLNTLPTGTILAPLDIGPDLLISTRHSVVATSHHRAAKAMRAVIDAFSGSADSARDIVRTHGVAYVAMCPDLAETEGFARANPKGFSAQLRQGKAPAWLIPIPLPAQAGLKVWRVSRP